jgi:WhiB family redox-sensing transcriptional regulator
VAAVNRFGWMEQANCVGHPTEWWFPLNPEDARKEPAMKAKALCRDCPVQDVCLAYAIENRDHYGIFGGLDPHERYTYRTGKQPRKANSWAR